MSVRDIAIEDWSETITDNPPSDGTFVRSDLAVQWQNAKAIIRDQSLELDWIRTGWVTASAINSGSGLSQIAFAADLGDLTDQFPVMRKIRLRPSSGIGTTIYAAVVSSLFGGTTSVIMAALVGLASSSIEYRVDLGFDMPDSEALPLYGQEGSVTITDPDQTAVATFDHKEPDKDYFVKVTVIESTSGVNGSGFIATIVKAKTGVTIGLAAVPTGGHTVVGWSLLREL